MPVEAPRRVAARRPTVRGPDDGRIVFHPRYEQFLRRCGVSSAADALALTGVIVCGHPDRHVTRVELPTGRAVYLKREHAVGLRTRFRNARAGFGWVSRGEREAETLRSLESAGLPGPQWMAYGEDEIGRAFLIVDELTGAADLRAVLSDVTLSPTARRELAEACGRAVGRLHAAGFGTPELAAKHVFVNQRSGTVTLVDWQSAGRPAPLRPADRIRQLAGLHASLGSGPASWGERLRFLWAYLREAGHDPQAGDFARAVLRAAGKRASRSSVRDQLRGPAPRLVWLAGESVCAVPELAPTWPSPAVAAPFYSDEPPGEEWITFPGGSRGRLSRFRTTDPAGRLAAVIRERPWRSPAAKAARVLFHMSRSRVAGPRLLAFGQRLTSPITADSFVLFELPAGVIAWRELVTHWTPAERRSHLAECGALVRRLHEARCRITAGDRSVLGVVSGAAPRVVVVDPFAVRLVKRLGRRGRRADIRSLAGHDLAGLSRSDRARWVRGYLGPNAERSARASIFALLGTVS